MKRYRFHIAIVAVLFGLVVIGYVASRDREPSYAGVPLSEWLFEAMPSYEGGVRFIGFPPDLLTIRNARGEAGIRQIGSNAIPWLLKELDVTDPSPWKMKLDNWMVKIGLRTNTFPADIRVMLAENGFRVLGPLAKPAVPRLLDLADMREPHYLTHMCRIVAHVDPAVLIERLHSRAGLHRICAAYGLSECDTNAFPETVPALTTAMENDPEPEVRLAAASSLSDITGNRSISLRTGLAHPDPNVRFRTVKSEVLIPGGVAADLGLPDVIQRVRVLTPELRREVVRILAEMAKRNRVALTILQAMLEDEDTKVRAEVKRAIDALNVPSPAHE